MILFDTSVLSLVFRRRKPGARERRVQETFVALMSSDVDLGMPGIVLQEVLSGVQSARQFEDLRAKLLGAFTVLPASVADHIRAAELRNRCTSKGANVSGTDCLIAVLAMSGGHELFTVDEDFKEIAKLSSLRLFVGEKNDG